MYTELTFCKLKRMCVPCAVDWDCENKEPSGRWDHSLKDRVELVIWIADGFNPDWQTQTHEPMQAHTREKRTSTYVEVVS